VDKGPEVGRPLQDRKIVAMAMAEADVVNFDLPQKVLMVRFHSRFDVSSFGL
jgi:hypothetical protein